MLCGNPPNGLDRFVWGWGNFQILRVFFLGLSLEFVVVWKCFGEFIHYI